MFTHLDLFSGIGGFALAAQWAGYTTVAFCEIDKFCQEVLQKRFGAVMADTEQIRCLRESTQRKRRDLSKSPCPETIQCGAPLFPDIRSLNGEWFRGVDLLTGGFPCQPVSTAGKRRGKEDNRWLWPEMLRVIKEARPRWVLAENVPGIIGLALDDCLSELEGEGYTTGTLIIPACAVNAPHRRDRVWIVAHAGIKERDRIPDIRRKEISSIRGKGQDVAHASREGLSDGDAGENRTGTYLQSPGKNGRYSWPDWSAQSPFCGVAHGISRRVHRLRSLGNAIVPQVAYEIIRRMPKGGLT